MTHTKQTSRGKKKPTSYRDVEGNGFFAENCTREEALELIRVEYLEYREETVFDRTADELREVVMRICLDCNSYWVDDGDGLCGDCGEPRLSKRSHYAWFFEC